MDPVLNGVQLLRLLKLVDAVNTASCRDGNGQLLPQYRPFEPGDVYSITQAAMDLVVSVKSTDNVMRIGFEKQIRALLNLS